MQKFLLMLVVVFGLASIAQAQNSGSPAPEPSATAPVQPIAFNHKLHIQTAKMACNNCHEPRGDGSTLALPQAGKCMSCHTSVATDKPEIKRLAEAAKNEDPILWVRIYRVPSFVTFSHKTHSGNTCEECHGPVAERTTLAREKDTNMGSCIACHTAKGARTTCDTCHAIMSKNGHSPLEIDATVLAHLHIQARPSAPVSALNNGTRVGQLTSLASFLNAPML
ncbi:cytochrome c3 family protein [Edaphobacter albus]|uniref:cytochrome c3 family protein n=1 Tax=Edaphobacter sp. 4G125 TaxID=2763071 RepID=UPI001648C4D7|nr:cytochrome c3 family protein [Edaphobacter sp. 4G125]QNI37348.1 cytochrome c3 family protein [Edaphobacter sp. 4G125]